MTSFGPMYVVTSAIAKSIPIFKLAYFWNAKTFKGEIFIWRHIDGVLSEKPQNTHNLNSLFFNGCLSWKFKTLMEWLWCRGFCHRTESDLFLFHLLLILTFLPKLTFYLIARGFQRRFATGAARKQKMLTPPDTWSCPAFGLASVLMLRPISPALVLFPDFWVSNIPRYFCFAFFIGLSQISSFFLLNILQYRNKIKTLIKPLAGTVSTASHCKKESMWFYENNTYHPMSNSSHTTVAIMNLKKKLVQEWGIKTLKQKGNSLKFDKGV